MIVRPIAQLPSVYLEEPKLIAVCKASAESFEWMLAVWDPSIKAWFCGCVREFEDWIQDREEGDGTAEYCVEPTHFFELPDLPARIGTH